MDNGDIANFVLSQGPRGQGLHLLEGHLFVCFVIKIERAAAASVVANNALEDDGGSILRPLNALEEGNRLDPLTDDRRMLAASCGISVHSSAHRRQKRDFISWPQPRGGTRVFLIDRHGEGRRPLCQAWDDFLVMTKNISQRCVFGKAYRVARFAGEIFEHAEE